MSYGLDRLEARGRRRPRLDLSTRKGARMTPRRKLIEVSLPLEEINAQSAREKSIRHGHPSTLHLWWARRPLATARAVLFSQLVDDPSNEIDVYRQEAVDKGYEDPNAWAEHKVKQERERLFDMIRKMVDWDNLNDDALFDQVRAEIMRSTNNNPPAILDPFAGGGTIPLEAQRLGLEAHASDLNPVAVLINKALIEIPPKFAGREPVFPGAAGQRNAWPKATGLAEDVRRYGEWMRDEAEKRIGHLYPKAKLPGGGEATVIAWIWARTVICPNPACGIEMPLMSSWWLSKSKGKEAFILPTIEGGQARYNVSTDRRNATLDLDAGTVGRSGAFCVSCKTAVSLKYIREQGSTTGLGEAHVATIAAGNRQRLYLPPSAAELPGVVGLETADAPEGALGYYPRDIKAPIYGLDEFRKLFTNRQLVALTTLSDLITEVRGRIVRDAQLAGLGDGDALEEGGVDAAAYADAVAVYLGLAVSRSTDYNSALCSWHSGRETIRNVFGRQAIPMVWDFAEVNILSDSTGNFFGQVEWIARVLKQVPAVGRAVVQQANAAEVSADGALLSTDPPYYDNIGYSDLSDYFYVWLRRSLQQVLPQLLATVLVPKAEELVANSYRHGGAGRARTFFEEGFEQTFRHAREFGSATYPGSSQMTV